MYVLTKIDLVPSEFRRVPKSWHAMFALTGEGVQTVVGTLYKLLKSSEDRQCPSIGQTELPRRVDNQFFYWTPDSFVLLGRLRRYLIQIHTRGERHAHLIGPVPGFSIARVAKYFQWFSIKSIYFDRIIGDILSICLRYGIVKIKPR